MLPRAVQRGDHPRACSRVAAADLQRGRHRIQTAAVLACHAQGLQVEQRETRELSELVDPLVDELLAPVWRFVALARDAVARRDAHGAGPPSGLDDELEAVPVGADAACRGV
ncbi:hypothetical protein AURDEDRAFT_162055 [Auricularia subglabra TFB-10046 SS5]|nr:hypothetical protein AURDEDRAFT_162055 [Auricularia subglabra TFB-10046 SS5]